MPKFYRNGVPVGDRHPLAPLPPKPVAVTPTAAPVKSAPKSAPETVHAFSTIAVAVVCHPPYIQFLGEAIRSVDTQRPAPAEKILCLDYCDFNPPPGWKVVQGQWKNPNPARNIGWQETTAPWVVFWDGDDVMPQGYINALQSKLETPKTGIVYPSLARATYGSDGKDLTDSHTPDWDFWQQRQTFFIQSGAAWNRMALFQVGGWDNEAGVHDDGNLASRITALGWKAIRLPSPKVILRRHDLGHRWIATDEQRSAEIWRFKTLTVIIPICRTVFIDPIKDTLRQLKIPAHCALLVVDNTPDKSGRKLLDACDSRWMDVRVMTEPLTTNDRNRNGLDRHQHIAAIYNRAFRAANTDMMFTWEDDVRIPVDAIQILWEHFLSHSRTGGAAGIYESAENRMPGYVCGSTNMDRWVTTVKMEDAPTKPESWGFIHGGCTLWAGHAILPCMPFRASQHSMGVNGWDNNVSRDIRAGGWKLIMDGRVRCNHEWRLT